MININLKKGKERSINLKHPWVFSGAIEKISNNISEGDLVSVSDHSDKFLARGYYHSSSIAVRILTFEKDKIDQEFWNKKIRSAYDYRISLGLISNDENNTFRLFNAEGDNVPGLIIDYYAGHCVVQSHSNFIDDKFNLITTALENALGSEFTSAHLLKAHDKSDQVDKEEDSYTAVLENGLKFIVNWHEGQKTGFFLDQKENRSLLRTYSNDKTVLNTFAYSGGFSINALAGGAKHVDSVDSSAKAASWAKDNIELNFKEASHEYHTIDAIKFLQSCERKYDIVILDPPAYAKRRSAVKNAEKGYRRLHQLAFPLIENDGLLFTFSCSQAVDMPLFKKIVFQAAAESGRQIRIVKQLHQSADHPINIYHPEGEYLKGLLLHIF